MSYELIGTGRRVDERFYLAFEYCGSHGRVEFVIETGWRLNDAIQPPRPAFVQAWDNSGRPVRHPITHQTLEDTFVRALETDTQVITDLLVAVHDDYLKKGGSDDVVVKSPTE